MSIELYREGLPRVDIQAGHISGGEGMLVGVVESSDTLAAILMLEDGTLSLASLADFRIQFHYDAETDTWVDENKVEPDQEVA
jgi:hypothetical protein